MAQAHKVSNRLCLTTRQAPRHCQVSVPALKRWIRDGRLAALKTPGGHCRIELEELQRFLRQYGMPHHSAPDIRILIYEQLAQGKGTALGLAVGRRMVQEHHGTIVEYL